MSKALEDAALALAVRLHGYTGHGCGPELAALEDALRTAPMLREAIEDLPRMLELERTEAPESEWDQGWNAACEKAGGIARLVIMGRVCDDPD